MRLTLCFLLLFPYSAMADDLSLKEIREARNYVLRSANCAEIGGLFGIPADESSSMSDEFTTGLLFASTYIEGVAKGRGVSYGTLLVEWAAYCADHPDSFWLEFE